jgi:hypothetical protein
VRARADYRVRVRMLTSVPSTWTAASDQLMLAGLLPGTRGIGGAQEAGVTRRSRLVRGGARVAGAHGDAWLRVDAEEHVRRQGNTCEDIVMLAALEALPVGVELPLELLAARQQAVLRAAPGWAVSFADDHVVRLLRSPVHVELVTCRARAWGDAVRRAAAFRHFAPAAVVLDRLPRRWPEQAWQADAAGVGVLVDDGSGPREVVPTRAPTVSRKAVHWRFEERAYRAWAVSR